MDIRKAINAILEQDIPENVALHLRAAVIAIEGSGNSPKVARHPAPEGFFEVPGFRKYAVSRRGEVWGYPHKKLLKPSLNKGHGYLEIDLYDEEKKRRKKLVQEIVAMTFLGPRPPNSVIRHLNEERHDNSIENLAYGTASENKSDAVKNGRHSLKLSWDDQEEIRYLYRNGEKQRELAAKFEVSIATISRVVNHNYHDDHF